MSNNIIKYLKQALGLIKNKGILFRYTEKINFNGKKFDIIFLFHVLEHIQNPKNFLLEIKKHLKDSGTIYLEVPNIDDALYSIYNLKSYKEFYFRLPHVIIILILH